MKIFNKRLVYFATEFKSPDVKTETADKGADKKADKPDDKDYTVAGNRDKLVARANDALKSKAVPTPDRKQLEAKVAELKVAEKDGKVAAEKKAGLAFDLSTKLDGLIAAKAQDKADIKDMAADVKDAMKGQEMKGKYLVKSEPLVGDKIPKSVSVRLPNLNEQLNAAVKANGSDAILTIKYSGNENPTYLVEKTKTGKTSVYKIVNQTA